MRLIKWFLSFFKPVNNIEYGTMLCGIEAKRCRSTGKVFIKRKALRNHSVNGDWFLAPHCRWKEFKMSNKIFPGSWCKWVLVEHATGSMIGLAHKPKKIPGGYITKCGRRYVSSEGYELIPNRGGWDALNE